MLILNGWKEIAKYLERGVRTVQRWEQYGLPVHRPQGGMRTAVMASAEELDAWSVGTPVRLMDEVAQLKAKVAALKAEVERLHAARDMATGPPSPANTLTAVHALSLWNTLRL